MEDFDLVVVGSGSAGLAAGIYAGRYLLKTAVIGAKFGGEAANAGTIWNFPGAKGVEGVELMLTMRDQAEENGSTIIDADVTDIHNENGCFTVTADGKQYVTKALILAAGAERKHLGLVNEKELHGKGVHYCITCDGPLYTGKTIAVVGGGDASIKGVNLAAEYAQKIYLIVRGSDIQAEPANFAQMQKLGNKVEVLYNTEVTEIVSDGEMKKIEKILLSKSHNGSNEIALDGFFVEIGAKPNTEFPKKIGVELDERGYIKVDNSMQTNVPGVYAAGDATGFFGSFKQIITSSAMGAVAATSAYNHIKANPHLCEVHGRDTHK